MIYFSLPADFDVDTLKKLNYINNTYDDCCIKEVYGQITIGAIQNSGRVTNVLPQVDKHKFEQYVKQATNYGIEFNYTLNPSCFGNYEFSEIGIKQINTLLNNIWDMGVKNLTLVSPALIEIAIATGLKFDIKASTICEINSPSKANFYKKLGVKRLVVDADITRCFVKLKDICKSFGDGVEIIANNVCRKNCAYKIFHYNHEAHCTFQSIQIVKDYFSNRCLMQNVEDAETLMKLNWIRPEDLHFYESCGIHNFKIQGRQNILVCDLIKTVEAYCKRNYDGNLYDLITLFYPYNTYQHYIDNKKLDGFLDKFYEDPNFCNDMCGDCRYCLEYANNCIDNKKAVRIASIAKRVFEKHDKFKQTLKNINIEIN